MIYLILPKLINLYLSFIFQIGRGQYWLPKFPLCSEQKSVTKWQRQQANSSATGQSCLTLICYLVLACPNTIKYGFGLSLNN